MPQLLFAVPHSELLSYYCFKLRNRFPGNIVTLMFFNLENYQQFKVLNQGGGLRISMLCMNR